MPVSTMTDLKAIKTQARTLDPFSRLVLAADLLTTNKTFSPAGTDIRREKHLAPNGRRLWPMIGGSDLCLDGCFAAFETDLFPLRYKSGETVNLVVMTCPAVEAIGHKIGHPVHVIMIGDATHKPAGLAALSYGAYAVDDHSEDDDIVSGPEAGYDRWRAVSLQAELERPYFSPVAVSSDAIEVTLPKTMSASRFEKELLDGLARNNLGAWAMRDEGIFYCAKDLQIDPHLLQRATKWSDGSLSKASALMLMNTGSDIDRIASVIERMLVRYAFDIE
ncbi:hypothetical protein [Lichenifustis flavocetrariae]|uniref:Uncharacterized protein n=1 Tax=Lichenifustis flavocetrariae TaxID=2949735 RepID=A0AA41Z563_9HYPH|nr:hypothetical protein [Lichenifustis flavocetrariae]MCW6512990.1 hypothetical protein [Lichenifustis flavocetrariae]